MLNLKTINIFLGPSIATLPSEGAFSWGAIRRGPIPHNYAILLLLVVFKQGISYSYRIVMYCSHSLKSSGDNVMELACSNCNEVLRSNTILSYQPTEVTIRLEQELYTVAEDEGPLTVCAQIIDGSLNRSVNFTLRAFEGPGTAMGEFGVYTLTSQVICYSVVPRLEVFLINHRWYGLYWDQR